MVLRVLSVPAPAVGTDWRLTVPGQWLLDVVAIQATLTTPPNITSAADSGPNGLPLTISQNIPGIVWGVAGPFAGAVNRAVQHDLSLNPTGVFGQSANNALFSTANFSFDGWFKLDPTTNWTTFGGFFDSRLNTGTERIGVAVNTPVASPVNLFDFNASASVRSKTQTLARGAWNHHAWTWDGATLLQYLNGVLAITWGADVLAPSVADQIFVGRLGTNGAVFPGSFCACAWYGATLTAPQIAAHAAATATGAAYKAAVLANAPTALWMLDEVGSSGTRAATLRVTDGTTNVAQFPGGTIVGSGASYSWCWQSQAPSTNQSADGTTTVVQIPDLVVPGGYTIGTVTPDLAATDQWSNINVWWNDTTSDVPGYPGAVQASPYLNALLVPDYGGRG